MFLVCAGKRSSLAGGAAPLAHSLSQKNPIKAVIEKKGKFIEFEEEKNRQRKSPLNLSPKLLTCVSIFSHVSLNKINYFPLRRRKSFL